MIAPKDEGMLSVADQEKIINLLRRKGVSLVCSMCGHNDFGLLAYTETGIFLKSVPQHGDTVRKVPSVVLACNNCGDMHQFALKALGLLG